MKVQITAEAKKWLTLAEAPIARKMVMDMKDPENGCESAAELAMRAARAYRSHFENHGQKCEMGYPVRVLEAKAEIAGNQRVRDYYTENSGRLDVWVSGMVLFDCGVLKIGSYLSDIWALGPDEAADNLVAHSYIREFVEKKQ